MAESIFVRVKRIVSGSVEDMVDSMERAGGTSVMREAVRELDRVVDDVKAERDAIAARRLQAVRHQKMYRERLETLQQKAQFAMNEDREDLAEAALHRQFEFEAQLKTLAEIEAETGEQERELEESLASLEMRKAHMEEEVKHFEAARKEAGVLAAVPGSNSAETLRKVERIEAAYNRAIEGVGGVALKDAHEHASDVAEIDVMMKKREIEARMDALRNAKKAV